MRADGWHLSLTPREMFYAARLATVWVESNPRSDARLNVHERIRYTYWAFAAEYALHRLTGLTWFAGLRRFTTPTDVGPYQVKSTDSPNYHLIVPFNAADKMPFLLANVHRTGVVFRGWILGEEARVAGECHNLEPERPRRPEGWWVKPESLHPMDSLRIPRARRSDALHLLSPIADAEIPEGLKIPFHGAPAPPELVALARRLEARPAS